MKNRILSIIVLIIFTFLIIISFDSCKRSRKLSQNNISVRESSKRNLISQNNPVRISDRRLQQLRILYEDTINYWQYDEAVYLYNYTPQQLLQSGRGICWDYALYFYNESKKRGLDDVHFVISINLRHAWNEVWVNNRVYIIDATWGDTNPYDSIDNYFLIDATLSIEHYENDISVVNDTMNENDISSLYRGIITQDSKRQQYTAARPIVKLRK